MYKSLIVFGILCELIAGKNQNQSSLEENVKDMPSKRQAPINDIISLDLDSPSDIHIKIIKENNNQKLSEVDDGLLMYHGAGKHEKLDGLKPLKNKIYYKDVDFDDHGGESLNSNQQIGRFQAKNDGNSNSKFRGGSFSHVTQINKLSDGREFKPMKNKQGTSHHRDNTFIEQVDHNSPRKDGNPSLENEGIMIVKLDNESPINVLQNYKALSDKGLKPMSINNDNNYGKVREFIGRGVANVENDCEHRGNSLRVIHEGKKQQFHRVDNTLFSKTRKQPLQKQNCGGFRRESLENDGPSINYNEREGGEIIEESHSSNSGEDDPINIEKSGNDNSKFGNVRVENHAMSTHKNNKLDERNGDESSLISGHELKDGGLKGHTNFGDHKIDTTNNGDYSGDLSNYETNKSPINEQVILNGGEDYDSPTLTSFDGLDTENCTNNLVANYILNKSSAGDELNHKKMKYTNYHDDQGIRKDLTDYDKNHRSNMDNQNMQRSQSFNDIPPNGQGFEDIANHMLNKFNVKHFDRGKHHPNGGENHKFFINKDLFMNHRDFEHDFNNQENGSVNKNDENSENSLLEEEKEYDKSDGNYRNDLDSQGSKFNEKKHENFENDIRHQENGLGSDSNKIFENNFNHKGSECDEKYDVKYGNEQTNEYENHLQYENYLKQQKSDFNKRNHYQNHESDTTDLEDKFDTKNNDNFGRNNNINQQGNGNSNENQGDEIIQEDHRVKNDEANRNSKFYDYMKNRGGSLNGADTLGKKQELNSKNDKNNFGCDRNNEKHDLNSENDGNYNFGTDWNDEEDDVNSKKDVGSSDRHKILIEAIRNRFRGTTGSYSTEKTEKILSESEEDVEFSPRKSSRPICQDVTPEAHCIKEDDKYFCKIGKSSYTIYTGPNPSVSSKVIEDYVRSMFQKYGEGDRCLDMSFGAGKHGPCLKNKMPVDNQMSHFSQTTTISSKLFPGRKRGTLNIICTPLAPPPKGVDCRDDETSREVYYECRWRTPNKIVQC